MARSTGDPIPGTIELRGTGDGGADFQQRIGGILAVGSLIVIAAKVLLGGVLLPAEGTEQALGAVVGLLGAAAGFVFRGRVEAPARADELAERRRLNEENAKLQAELARRPAAVNQ